MNLHWGGSTSSRRSSGTFLAVAISQRRGVSTRLSPSACPYDIPLLAGSRAYGFASGTAQLTHVTERHRWLRPPVGIAPSLLGSKADVNSLL